MRLTVSILCVVFAGLCGLAAPVLPVVGFRLGEDGDLRNVAVPVHFVENLALRGKWEPRETEPGTVVWDAVWKADAPDRLVVVRSQFGARIELLGFLVGRGQARAAARRPASATFEARLDWGQPGAGQGEINAWRELAADLHRADTAETPIVRSLAPVAVSDRMLGPGKGLLYAATVEAMAVTAMVLDGATVRRGNEADAVRIEARRQATVFGLRVHGTWQRDMDACSQADLFPCLRVALRGANAWGSAVGAVRVLDSAWNPVAVVSADEQLLVRKGEGLLAFAKADGRPVEAPKVAPQPVAPASGPVPAGGLAQYEWAPDLLRPPIAFGDRALALTVSRVARLLDPEGRVAEEEMFPDRVHTVYVDRDGEVIVVDVAGRVWRWPPGAEPALHVELGITPHGPLVHAAAIFAEWHRGEDGGELSLESGAVGRFLLLGSCDGMLFHIPYPLVTP